VAPSIYVNWELQEADDATIVRQRVTERVDGFSRKLRQQEAVADHGHGLIGFHRHRCIQAEVDPMDLIRSNHPVPPCRVNAAVTDDGTFSPRSRRMTAGQDLEDRRVSPLSGEVGVMASQLPLKRTVEGMKG
jgi:hypothetical protein